MNFLLRIFFVSLQVPRHIGALRDHFFPPDPSILQGKFGENSGKSMAAQCRRNKGVGEHHCIVFLFMIFENSDFSVHMQLKSLHDLIF